ncbi:NAD(P)H-dependent oxidoreductase [Companilactobacillus ginsenosidimutans]|uniref:NADPH-quinone reductase n=1 Tax=Companilactobacillus ginsenosidimutans TaxID=1007676 RepID=A0A0H4QL30_9LACO|nr:NAD(P)H-dependent oxidoreductase [Companilactobacillus ginsenosidimutans]AKP67408.1 NADPH-quinone reductase [Companilactobacillus ginsenosidimutans]
MNTLVVYCHPYEGSFCHAILEHLETGADKAGKNLDVIDLYKDHFNPVMSGRDLLGFVKHQAVDEQAIDYANRLKKADHLVLVFPIWWELMPAMMKGFIDKVIFPGQTYAYKSNSVSMRTLLPNLKSTTVITTMNTPKIMYKFTYGNAIKEALIKGSFKKSGFKNVKWLSFNMVKMRSNETRVKWLDRAERVVD